ncbi:hypothetical protein VRK_35400 [Vibrio sp. MEBiC08052]|nr:hypothetical protein VRK_35400 [Vibrio sp. MEBiC08052]
MFNHTDKQIKNIFNPLILKINIKNFNSIDSSATTHKRR